MTEPLLLVTTQDSYALVRIYRPDLLNALSMQVMQELVETLDKDTAVRCIIPTGDEKAFAAGADITEMAEASAMEMLHRDQFARWDRI